MDIDISKDSGVLTLTFNRLEKKNAITAAMYQSLADALKDAEADATVRAVLIAGQPQIFTAGNDLDDFLKNPPSGADSPVFQFMQRMIDCSKPTIAAVAGPAVGIGTTLLLHCDLVYAAENARLSMPFSQLGLCPEFASSLLLPQLAGSQRAAEKLLLGEPFLAAEACAMGLVNRVLPADELLPFARAQAAKLVALPASSVRATKRLMKADQVAAIKARIMEENLAFGTMLGTREAKEAFAAFFEKRKPDFSRFA
ncbi:MAG: enoyl-CoA hydratase [Herminiimonas sp.]|nr:enoyl-CoA hydratase [Herminiimonas sp.]